MRTILPAVLSFAFFLSPAFAEGDDAAAVIKHCGTPTGERQAISQVTNRMERDLIYDRLILHFQPSQGGWSFLSGWYKHLPQTERMVERRMPCFAQAMAASTVEQPAVNGVDPTIRSQMQVTPADTATFGIPHLWLIVALGLLVVVLTFMPGVRRRPFRASEVAQMRQRRRPVIERFLQRKRKGSVDV